MIPSQKLQTIAITMPTITAIRHLVLELHWQVGIAANETRENAVRTHSFTNGGFGEPWSAKPIV